MLGMRYAAKLKQHPSHRTYNAVFSQNFLAAFRERRRLSEPFCVRVLRLFEESNIDLRGVTTLSHLATPPWQLIEPSVDTSLGETKKSELSAQVFRTEALHYIASFTDHALTYTDGSKTEEGVGCTFMNGGTTRCLLFRGMHQFLHQSSSPWPSG